MQSNELLLQRLWNKNTDKATILLVAFIFSLHLVLARQLGLGVDEAHYGLFALKLDWSYFDHPPMTGWLLALVTPFGQSDFMLRLVPALLMAINNWLLFSLGRRVYDSKVGLAGVVLFNLGGIVQLIGWGMVPDVPLMTWLLLMVHLLLNMEQQGFTTRRWIALGILMGLCGLTKYTSIFVPVALIYWLIRQHQLMMWIRQPGLWLAVLIAFLCIQPVILWNWTNDWVSFSYQFDHGTAGQWHWVNMARMLLVEWLAFAPLTTVLGIWGLVGMFSRTAGSAERLLVAIGVSNLAVVAWSAGHGELLPHWAVVGWLFLSPIAAFQWLELERTFRGRWLRTTMMGLSGIILLVLFSLIALRPVNWIPEVAKVMRDVIGWQSAAQHALVLKQQHNAEQIWVNNWTQASRISWYAGAHPVQVTSQGQSQFKLWWGEPDSRQTALMVLQSKGPERIKPWPGSQCQLLEQRPERLKGVVINQFSYYFCQSLDS